MTLHREAILGTITDLLYITTVARKCQNTKISFRKAFLVASTLAYIMTLRYVNAFCFRLLALWEGNPPMDYPHDGSVIGSLDVLFVDSMNKLVSRQPNGA